MASKATFIEQAADGQWDVIERASGDSLATYATKAEAEHQRDLCNLPDTSAGDERRYRMLTDYACGYVE